MINIDNVEKFVTEELSQGEHFSLRKEGWIELITRLRQAEKDAARYRWLRGSASTEDHGGFAYSFRLVDAIRYMPGAAPNETMDIDAAIDEAMQCNK